MPFGSLGESVDTADWKQKIVEAQLFETNGGLSIIVDSKHFFLQETKQNQPQKKQVIF